VAEFETVARLDKLQPGSLACARAGEEELALARIGDEVYALHGHCIHLQGPLCEGHLEGYVMSCPWHGWQYDVRTGENEFDRAIKLETYPVRIEDGEVKVAV
jgi:nitrite reductase/ring-hydroxylating ferredoxin subunit